MIAALLLLACSAAKTDTADTSGPLTFHGQAWLIEGAAVPWGVCVDGERAIAPDSCWVCVELDYSGDARSWWGVEEAGGLPWSTRGAADLGRWTSTGPDAYDVNGAAWEALDESNGAPWSQTGRVRFDDGVEADVWQGSATWAGMVCASGR